MNNTTLNDLFGGGFGGFEENIAEKHNISLELYNVYNTFNVVIDVVLVFPTIFGNVLILVAIGHFSGLRKCASGILIGNLAVSDLLVGMFIFPLDLMLRLRRDLFNYVNMCLLLLCIIYSVVGASVGNLFLLSLERFHAVIFPLKHKAIFTKQRIHIAIAAVWICTTLGGFLPFLGWHYDVHTDKFICGNVPILTETYTKVINSFFVFTLIINSVFFFIIAKAALDAASSFSNISRTVEEQERLKKNIRHTRMMLMVSGLFVVFWGPFCIASLVPGNSPMLLFVRAWLSELGLINSSINWIVYGCRSKKFRLAFKALLTCTCSKGKVEISSVA